MCKLTDLIKQHPYSKIKTVPAGRLINLSGCVGLVLSGVVATSAKGSEYILRLTSAKGFLNIIQTDSRYEALEECRLVYIPARYIQGVEVALLQALAKENQQLSQAVLNARGVPLLDRLRLAIDELVGVGLIRATNSGPMIMKGQLRCGTVNTLSRLVGSSDSATSRVLQELRLEYL
jgi:hypothetical protein